MMTTSRKGAIGCLMSNTGKPNKRKARGKKTAYAIYYKDNSYMTYDLTKSDYEALRGALGFCEYVETSIGMLATGDIRAVIEQRPLPPQEEKPTNPPLSQDAYAWIYGKEGDTPDGI